MRRTLLAAALLAASAAAQFIPPFPPVPVPPQNPLTPAKAVLGKILFFDEQLSADGTVACGTCHIPEAGGADPRSSLAVALHPGNDGILGTADDVRGSPGVVRCQSDGSLVDDGVFFPRPQVTPRRAPSVINAAFAPALFWDGRAGETFADPVTGAVLIPGGAALETLAVQPPVSDVEMGCLSRTITEVAQKVAGMQPLRLAGAPTPDVAAALASSPTYPALFAAAFGDPAVTPARIGLAIASYLRTQVADQTPFDLFISGANPNALTPAQQNGLTAFFIARCDICHAFPLFTENLFHVNGATDPSLDPGRGGVTGLASDQGAMRTPSLRNVGLREAAGLMHSGAHTSLSTVVASYAQGGLFTSNLDPLVIPFFLSPAMTADLIDFLRNGLTDPRAAAALPPFDRPVLRSEMGPNPALLPSGSPGTGSIVPTMVALQPPALGAATWTIGLGRGLPLTSALLAVSLSPAAPGSTILGGIPLHLGLDSSLLLFPITLSPTGHASLVTPLPSLPALAGVSLWGQWFVSDPGGVSGLAASEGMMLTFF